MTNKVKNINSNEGLVVLVDENNHEIGTALKSEVHTNNTPLHRAFSVYIFNKKRELLLQQRSSKKKTWPLVWSNSCCGHPGVGEDTKEAVLRRVKEELGVEIEKLWNVLPDFRYRAELDGIVENEICPVFVAFTEQQPKINQEEVESTRWITWDKFLIEEVGDDLSFSPWGILQVGELHKSAEFNKLLVKYAI